MLCQFEREADPVAPSLCDKRRQWLLFGWTGRTAVLLVGLIVAVPLSAAADQPAAETSTESRAAVPDEAALKPAVGVIHTLFKDEFAKAKKPADKVALAEKLLAMAGESEVEAERYALLAEVRSLGIAAAQPALVAQAVSAMSETFAIDRLTTLAVALEECGGKEWPIAARKELVAEVAPLVDEALSAGQFKLARRLAAVGLAATRKTNQAAEGKQFARQGKEAAALEKQSLEVETARRTLANSPDDAAANTMLGKYLCLLRADWEQGLPHLAKGNDDLLRTAAQRDLAVPATTAERVKAGDAWWAAADKQLAGERARALARAGYWYRQAVDELAGLNQIKVQKRLAELPGEASDAKSTSSTAPAGKAVETAPRGKSLFLTELQARDVKLYPGVGWSDAVNFAGTRYEHGLQAHPDAGGFGRIVFDLPPKFRTLQGAVGIDDFVAGMGGSGQPIVFRIVADGKELWKSRPIQKIKDSEKFSVDVTGVKQLELFADCPSTWGAHSVWIDPQLLAAAPPSAKAGPKGPATKTELQVPATKPVEPGPQSKSMFLNELKPKEVNVYSAVRWSDPVNFDGRLSPHGMQAHPGDGGYSRLAFELPGKFRSLRGTVGIDDSMAAHGGSSNAIVFRIVGDGKEIWKSRPIQKTKEGEPFAVDISGINRLELYAECPPMTQAAHAVWVEPQLLTTASSAKAAPPIKAAPTKTSPTKR